MSKWNYRGRSANLTEDEWDALYRTKAVPKIRQGSEWTDCPECNAGISIRNLGPLTIEGACHVCCGTGRVLISEKQAAESMP